MYEVLTERRRFPSLLFKKIINLGPLTPNETTIFKRYNKVGGKEEIEVEYEVTPFMGGGDIEALIMTVTNLPMLTISLPDYHRKVPKIVTALDVDRPTIRSHRSIQVIQSAFGLDSPRLAFVQSELLPYVTGLSDDSLEAAESLEAIVRELKRPMTPQEEILNQTVYNVSR